ncbi:MAG: CHAT domain-containing protein [Coleofasciculus sp. C1-SOL-03]|uniref:CHAT domain-containing tetratricopeptide repeat protein n=1 Tax=Coleofasciculus sp. C1-SOL-03 TaxID=3069522 RepID=UPI0032FAF508
MTKLVIFRPVGNLETQGFSVHLIIQEKSDSPAENQPTIHTLLDLDKTNALPPNPELAAHLHHHWLELYRPLGEPARTRKLEVVEVEYEGTLKQRIHHCKTSAQELCDRMKAWLDSDSFHSLDKQLRENLNPDDSIQFLIRTEDPQLLKLPWQEWDFFHHYSQAEPARIPLQSQPTGISPKTPQSAKIRILAILGHSQGIDVDKDRKILENLPNTETTFLVEKTHQDINDQLWEQSWDIIFFAGHSETINDTGRIYINPTDYLTVNELWCALKKAVKRGLKLAIFNSCDGLGLAQQLDDLNIPQMIVMRELIPDKVAQAFLTYFLTEFAGGQSFHQAVRSARERLQGMETDFPCASWLPLICQNLITVPTSWQELGGISNLNLSLDYPSLDPIPKNRGFVTRFNHFSKLTLILLFGGLISYFFLGFRIAPWFNKLGVKNYNQGQLLKAQFYYRFATLLDINYPHPHYNLAWLCEKNLKDTNCAMKAYEKAALRGLAEAHAQLALGQIRGNFPEASLSHVWQCLTLTEYDAVKAACFKNRGLIRFTEGRLSEAEDDLKQAIQLEVDSPHAHCLLAQVLEATERPKAAEDAWKNTLHYAKSKYYRPELDECIGEAKQRLQDLED